jgi:hypothetical protein
VRWYTTRNGTFTAVDPFAGLAEQPYSQHPYQYAYANPVLHTDPSGQVVDDGDGGGRGRCIPIVERWDPFLQACVPNLGPPPPNNRLTNDAAQSYAQAFDDLVGSASRSPAPFKGGIVRRPDGTIIFVPEAEDEGEPTGGLGPGITWGIRGALLLCVAGVLAQAIGPAAPSAPNAPPERPTQQVNVDTGTAVAFIAEGSPILATLEGYVAGKQMVMTRTAYIEFFKIVTTIAGSNERARSGAFIARVREIPDDPSDRALNLRPTGGIGANDIIVFGTGDRLVQRGVNH